MGAANGTPTSVGGRRVKKSGESKNKVGADYRMKITNKQKFEDSDFGESEGDSYNYIFRNDNQSSANIVNRKVAGEKQLMATGEFDTRVQDFDSTTGDFLHFQDTQYMEKSPVSNLSQF